MPAEDPQLGDGGMSRMNVDRAIDSGGFQQAQQALAGFIIATQPQQTHPPAEGSNVQRDVARPASPLLDLADTHDRHGSLGRNPRRTAMPVAIQHQVADH